MSVSERGAVGAEQLLLGLEPLPLKDTPVRYSSLYCSPMMQLAWNVHSLRKSKLPAALRNPFFLSAARHCSRCRLDCSPRRSSAPRQLDLQVLLELARHGSGHGSPLVSPTVQCTDSSSFRRSLSAHCVVASPPVLCPWQPYNSPAVYILQAASCTWSRSDRRDGRNKISDLLLDLKN